MLCRTAQIRPRACPERSGVGCPVKELLMHNLPVLHRIKRHFFHVVPFAGGLEGHVVVVVDRELVIAEERPVDCGGVHFIVIRPPLVFPSNGVEALHFAWHRRVSHRFDADDVRRVKRVDRVYVASCPTKGHELLGDGGGVGGGGGGHGALLVCVQSPIVVKHWAGAI